MKKIYLVLLALLFSFTLFSQVSRSFNEIKANKLDELVTGNDVDIENSNLIEPKINDTTIQNYFKFKVSNPISDSLNAFYSLQSKNKTIKMFDSYDKRTSFYRKSFVNKDTVIVFYDDALGMGTPIQTGSVLLDGLTTTTILQSDGYIGIKATTGLNLHGYNTPLLLYNFTCSLTDGAPTDAEIDACIVEANSQFVMIKDSDGTGGVYLCFRYSGQWYYLQLTVTL